MMQIPLMQTTLNRLIPPLPFSNQIKVSIEKSKSTMIRNLTLTQNTKQMMMIILVTNATQNQIDKSSMKQTQ
jgi:hypothetical protein